MGFYGKIIGKILANNWGRRSISILRINTNIWSNMFNSDQLPIFPSHFFLTFPLLIALLFKTPNYCLLFKFSKTFSLEGLFSKSCHRYIFTSRKLGYLLNTTLRQISIDIFEMCCNFCPIQSNVNTSSIIFYYCWCWRIWNGFDVFFSPLLNTLSHL